MRAGLAGLNLPSMGTLAHKWLSERATAPGLPARHAVVSSGTTAEPGIPADTLHSNHVPASWRSAVQFNSSVSAMPPNAPCNFSALVPQGTADTLLLRWADHISMHPRDTVAVDDASIE